MSFAYKYTDEAWEDLPAPWVGRALRSDAQLKLTLDRPRGVEPRKPNSPRRQGIVSGYGISAAKQEAADRAAGGPTVTLKPTYGVRALSTGPKPTARAVAKAKIEELLRDPLTREYGNRALVSSELLRSMNCSVYSLRVLCKQCNQEHYVNAMAWATKSPRLGVVCPVCTRKNLERARVRKREPDRQAAEGSSR